MLDNFFCKRNIIALVSIFVLVSLVGGLWLKVAPDFGVKEDAEVYDNIAMNLAQGKGFTQAGLPVSEAPGYPFFLAGVYFLFGHNYTYVKIIQLLILGLIGAIVYFIAKNFLNLSFAFAFLASITVVLWPYFLLYSNLLLTEVIFSLMLILLVYLILQFQKNPQYLNAAAIGGILGIAALTRPVALLLPFWLCAGFVLLFKKFRKKAYFFKLTLLIIVFLATLMPWTIRNYVKFNKLVPIRSGYSVMVKKAYLELNYFNLGDEAKAPGETTIKDVAVAKLKNIYIFWRPGARGTQATALMEKYPQASFLILIYQIAFFIMLGLAFISWKFFRNKKILMLWVVIMYFWGLHTVLYPYPRYTLPIIPIVIVLCFFTLHSLLPQLMPTARAKNTSK